MLFWFQMNLVLRIWADPFGLFRPTTNKKKPREQ